MVVAVGYYVFKDFTGLDCNASYYLLFEKAICSINFLFILIVVLLSILSSSLRCFTFNRIIISNLLSLIKNFFTYINNSPQLNKNELCARSQLQSQSIGQKLQIRHFTTNIIFLIIHLSLSKQRRLIKTDLIN